MKIAKEIFLVLVSLLFVQVAFFYVQISHEKAVLLSIQALVNQEEVASNPYSITQGLENLEAIGLIRCSKLSHKKNNVVYADTSFKGNCETSFLKLNGRLLSSDVVAINGEEWLIEVVSNNSREFNFMLWIVRFLVVALSISLYKLYHWRLNSLMNEKNLQIAKHEMEITTAIRISQIASQVSHDIRSPLAALQMGIEDLKGVSKNELDIIYLSIQRINNIASDLLNYNKNQKKVFEPSSCSIQIVPLVEAIILEKKIQFKNKRNLKIHYKTNLSSETMVAVSEVELGRVLSNVINNAVEAMDESGELNIDSIQVENKVFILIKDNGKGIPHEIFGKIGQEGFSYGKDFSASGSGLGLFHAKKVMKEFGGELIIHSELTKGTTVEIIMPIYSNDNFYDYVCIDDDQIQHMLWKKKAQKAGVKLLLLSSCEEFHQNVHKIDKNKTHIYLDSDLGENKIRGEEFAKELHLAGYKLLTLATGLEADNFSDLKWLAVRGKGCPF